MGIFHARQRLLVKKNYKFICSQLIHFPLTRPQGTQRPEHPERPQHTPAPRASRTLAHLTSFAFLFQVACSAVESDGRSPGEDTSRDGQAGAGGTGSGGAPTGGAGSGGAATGGQTEGSGGAPCGAEAGDALPPCPEEIPFDLSQLDAPQFTEVSVHDPSVVEADGSYWVFGSHLAAASTENWMDWSAFAHDGVNAQNPLFANVNQELSEVFAWSTVESLWAADVLQLRQGGRYLMYYNSCKGDEAVSAMGLATASQVEGPYEDEGIFLRSGFYFHSQNNPDGSWNNTAIDPNAIDPDAFYDAEGKLWLVYGSYSGGIYILELDATTGLPLSRPAAQYYGKHLLGGGHVPIEGPYIHYSPLTEYYYLFTSYGGLGAADGYNLRVARSREPDGPYVDSRGVDQAEVNASADFNLSGVKLLGNHRFQGTDFGYVSAGHNSAYFDESLQKHFLIFHTRFYGRGEMHQVRVHELLPNAQAWLLVSPFRFVWPEIDGRALTKQELASMQRVLPGEVPGSYEFVNHGRDTSGTIKTTQTLHLHEDGSVSGAATGSWQLDADGIFTLTLAQVQFQGVLTRGYSEAFGAYRVGWSALSAAGESAMGVQTNAE